MFHDALGVEIKVANQLTLNMQLVLDPLSSFKVVIRISESMWATLAEGPVLQDVSFVARRQGMQHAWRVWRRRGWSSVPGSRGSLLKTRDLQPLSRVHLASIH